MNTTTTCPVTLSAEASSKLKDAFAAQSRADLALRVYIKPGGCAGFSYGMGLDEKKNGDQEFETDGIRIVIDPFSAQYLEGAEIGYKNEMMGGGFTVTNPNAASGCGCGTSFRPKDAEAPAAGGACGTGGCC